MNIDQGILTNKDQLPVNRLNYGGGENRYSWITYQLGHLKCYGKNADAVYPSEKIYENRISALEKKAKYDYYFKTRFSRYSLVRSILSLILTFIF